MASRQSRGSAFIPPSRWAPPRPSALLAHPHPRVLVQAVLKAQVSTGLTPCKFFPVRTLCTVEPDLPTTPNTHSCSYTFSFLPGPAHLLTYCVTYLVCFLVTVSFHHLCVPGRQRVLSVSFSGESPVPNTQRPNKYLLMHEHPAEVLVGWQPRWGVCLPENQEASPCRTSFSFHSKACISFLVLRVVGAFPLDVGKVDMQGPRLATGLKGSPVGLNGARFTACAGRGRELPSWLLVWVL